MEQRTLRVLEYEKIIAMLVSQAGSQRAKDILEHITPSGDIGWIREGLLETTEAVSLITYKGPLPMGSFYDTADALALAQKGAV